MSQPKTVRLDVYLVEHGLFPTRARARAAIDAGLVRIAGAIARKPSASVAEGAEIAVEGDVHDYVSRSALKLEAGFDAFAVDPAGAICLDLGASTGGFTEILIRRGAVKVYAVDVGTGQLHPRIAGDAHVVNLEKTHAKDLSRALIPDPVDLLVCDVSFISLRKSLPPALALCAEKAVVVALIKPQFELGPEKIGKGGIVKADEAEIAQLLEDMKAWFESLGWRVLGVLPSPIKGGDGNQEYLLGAAR